jgi:hypothetical protein
MSRGQNTIKRSEVSTTPILLKYSASYGSSSFLANGITVNRGINSSFSTNGVQFLNYALVKQLYYQEYLTGSLLSSSSFWNPSNQSTAASGTFDDDYRYFPTSSSAEITVIGIPRTVFGEQIARKSFIITGSTFTLIDDGNGNVIDSKNSNSHVGNILYSQGVVVITNQDYQNTIIKPPPVTVNWTRANYENNGFIPDYLVLKYTDYYTGVYTTLDIPSGGTGTPPDSGVLTVVGGTSVFVSAQNTGFNNIYYILTSAAINSEVNGNLVSINIPIGSSAYTASEQTFTAQAGVTYTVNTYGSATLP